MDIEKLKEEVRRVAEKHGYRRVLFHLPSGLMNLFWELKSAVPQALLWAEPCFGACDVPLIYAEKLEVDAIFSFGHSEAPSLSYPSNVHFFEVEVEPSELPDFIPPCKRIGLVYAIQYRKAALAYKEFLESKGKLVLMGKPKFMAKYEGQVTGCDITAAQSIADKVDCFVFCGDGSFHALELTRLGKPVFNWWGERFKPRKARPILGFLKAEKVCVIVGVKPGQFKEKLAEIAVKKVRKLGKEVILAYADRITQEVLNLQADFYIIAACPRLEEDLPNSMRVEDFLRLSSELSL